MYSLVEKSILSAAMPYVTVSFKHSVTPTKEDTAIQMKAILALIMLWANSADDKHDILLIFPRK